MKPHALHKNLYFWLFLIPALFFFINVVIIPFILGIVYSFTNWNGFQFLNSKFIGTYNYKQAFSDKAFLSSMGLTFEYAIITVILVNIIGFFLALLVTRKFKSSHALRAVFFMPNLIGGLVLGFIWQLIFSKFMVFIGQSLKISSLSFNWLNEPNSAFWSLVIVSTWQMAGYVMIIYIAGLQSIPRDVLEAAQIDGANSMQRLRHIVLPLMMPSFTVNLFIVLSNAFKQYDTNLSLTNGGPYGTTQLLAMNIYQTAFSHNNYAVAQAKAVIFFLIIMVVTLLQVHFTSKREVEA